MAFSCSLVDGVGMDGGYWLRFIGQADVLILSDGHPPLGTILFFLANNCLFNQLFGRREYRLIFDYGLLLRGYAGLFYLFDCLAV